MPIYEYVCENCETRYERIVLSKGADVRCPQCKSKKAALQPSLFSSRIDNSNPSDTAVAMRDGFIRGIKNAKAGNPPLHRKPPKPYWSASAKKSPAAPAKNTAKKI